MSFQAFSLAVRSAWRPPDGCLILFESCPSTHAVARRLVHELEADGSTAPRSAFLAWSQTAGHGRQGRAWSSPPGAGVYASLLRAVEVPVQELPLRVAVGLATAAQEQLGASGSDCRLKWPNDLLLGGRKFGGILVDVFSEPDEKPVALISFGINVSATSDTLIPGATSLGLAAQPELLATVTIDMVAGVDREIEAAAIFSGGFHGILERFRRLSAHQPGEELSCHVGEELIRGTYLGLDDRGFLRLAVDGKERILVAGEIHA
jgi:BirA family biotin operon repressor/biotin-[acetyl-CoA-carboxylase] ligase